MTALAPPKRSLGLGLFFVIAGVVGFAAAFALTLDKFEILKNPKAALGCNFSVLVQCGANLNSPQGAVFGFPNPLLGVAGFMAIIVIGAAILSGARFDRWFWLVLNAGMLGALIFVIWLIGQSIFVLGTLCPWCMVVWSATIPLFLVVTLGNIRSGAFGLPQRVLRGAGAVFTWIPFITLLCYLIVATIAQLRLDVLRHL
ncbi:MAG: vitamin K epoxide reductase family protein [Microbacteriaceae bacterium]|nr:vitamin K epoxide reductase family protein [Microbacteriaceae bacterium]